MSDALALLLFRLCTIASVLLIFHALRSRHYWAAFAAGLFAMPVSIYLAFFPRFMFIPVLFPAMIMLAGNYLRLKRRRTAQLLVGPYLIVLAWLAWRAWARGMA